MCRMAAYLGPPIALRQFLLEPAHGLVIQARQPRELHYTTVNADGFGLGWFVDRAPALYLNPMPIWSDPNLPHLGRSLTSDLWMGNVRSATGGLATGYTNTQPFTADGLIFMHNGFIRNFETQVRPRLHAYLDPRLQTEIRGNTDSEFLFALVRQVQAHEPEQTLTRVLSEVCRQLEQWIGEAPAMLNFIIADGRRLIALRHALNDVCPSLYYTADDENFPDGELVASERLTDHEFWQQVPDHSVLVLDRDAPPDLISF